jgi:hypothetical protein
MSLDPWYAAWLDLTVIAGLVAIPPKLRPVWDNPRDAFRESVRWMVEMGTWAAVGSGMLLIAAGAGTYYFGSLHRAVAYVRGERLMIDPAVVEVGPAGAREIHSVSITVQNWSKRPVALVGTVGDCSHTVDVDFPVMVPPGGHSVIPLRIFFPDSPGGFRRAGALLTNHPDHPRVGFTIAGECVPPGDAEIDGL